MTRSLRPILGLALTAVSSLLLAFGCGGETAQSSGSCDADVPEGRACTATPKRLCDGSSHLTFATLTAGGNLNGVPRIASEIGWSFLLIDGQCRYWAMSGPEGEVRTGTLDADEEAEISEAFLLGHWDELDGNETEGCLDAPVDYFRFHDDMRGAVCWTHELTEAIPVWHERLFDAGTPQSGAVRYTLADATESAWAMTMPEIGLSWPLAEDPAALAVGLSEDEGDDVEPSVATGDDAAALRALRASYAENMPASGLGPWLRVPVIDEVDGAEARYFDLALRDVTPFEVDGQLDVDAFFE